MTDSKWHFPLADKRTKITIVVFKPDPDTGCDLFVVFQAVSGTAGSKESNGFVRQTGKEVADALAQLAGAPIDKKKIELETKDIKDAGFFNGKVRLHVGVVASFKIMVEVEQA